MKKILNILSKFNKKKQINVSNNIISSITELTLDKFIICVCDGNLSVLVKDWFLVKEKNVYEAWENIYTEYVNAIEDKEQRYILRLTKEINLLQCKLVMIHSIINTISTEYQLTGKSDEKLLANLRKYINVTGKFDPNDTDGYMRDLEFVIANYKRLMIEFQTKKIEYEKLIPKNSKSKVDRKYFDSIITQISKHMKSIIDPKNITVSLFVAMMMDMKTEAERIEKEIKKAKQHGK